MIKQQSIEEVRDAVDIVDLISGFTKIVKKGANYTGCCPFHDEKTPSFVVSPAKQIYKCFGCGKQGDAFTFIIESEHKTFYEAIEFLADRYNIQLDYDQQQQEQSQETKDAKAEQLAITKWAYEKYCEAFRKLPDIAPAIQYLQERGYSRKQCESTGYGFAPMAFKFLTTDIINMGKYQAALDCKLINTKEGVSNDFFYFRIIIPIYDTNGVLVGMAGRQIPTDDKEKDKKYAKYLNPAESLIYNKKKIWYGLWKARKAIKERGCAYIVEGYFDVDTMHFAGLLNTIASCGTAIDEDQVRFLKRYTDHVKLCFDGDNPGIEKMLSLIDIFLKHDFKVSVCEIPGKMDPDEYIRKTFIHIYKKKNAEL